ncbi:glycosyltransferase family A protein [Polynucleobacter sp. MG-6-Vaara-E2]|uniref:glycosyltransferase family A protein n=1 Tax=Polynucleobacter sp. MG-6-Vaara-E2 TaxID=2576932 RepID=UPI001BFDFEDF|nr:glycosyltransferase family A protein [Polynucleobacter sp. MG-6-Vaara-E2]QWD96917.1 glycosyltransferase family 2 protein [Polynucleobacter sp. MG-6-Vaara-E2]
MNNIKFSVITTNYNDANFLPRNFASVEAQTYNNYEHILVDDCSTDESISVINGYINSNSNASLFFHDHNLGPAAGVGTGISKSTGTFSTFLSADDELDPFALENINKIVINDINAKLICGDVIFVDPDGNQFKRSFFRSDAPIYFSPEKVKDLMRKGVFIINGGGSFVNIAKLIRTPFNDPFLEWHCDSFAYSMIGLIEGFWYVPSTLHKFYIRQNNFSLGAKIWSEQKHVIKHSLDLLDSSKYCNLKELFKESSFFASYPHILKFLFLNYKSYSDFLTFNLFINALIISTLRNFRKIFPRFFINYYNNIKSFTWKK